MQDITLYSTGCPRCIVLERKLAEKNVVYRKVDDVDEIMAAGMMEVPVLQIGDDRLRFADAVEWINNLEAADEH